MIVAFYKPFGVLSQFSQECPGQKTLAEFNFSKDLWPIGRLDQDSEGLLLLTNEKQIIDKLLNPNKNHSKTYDVQVEGIPNDDQLAQLRRGNLLIRGHLTRPCFAQQIQDPHYPERIPTIRVRKSIPDSWIELTLTEGKNRQVRRMTAAVGLPTLRLIRSAIGLLKLKNLNLSPGNWKELNSAERKLLLTLKQ